MVTGVHAVEQVGELLLTLCYTGEPERLRSGQLQTQDFAVLDLAVMPADELTMVGPVFVFGITEYGDGLRFVTSVADARRAHTLGYAVTPPVRLVKLFERGTQLYIAGDERCLCSYPVWACGKTVTCNQPG
jgi:hypothetical protein